MTDWVVSHSDVELHPKFKNGEWSLEKVLYSYGMDVKEGFESDGREKQEGDEEDSGSESGYTHRSPFTGKVHTCPRYFGVARTDGRWKTFTEVFVAVTQ